jgi:hypothetical protein
VLLALIEIKARLLSALQIKPVLDAVNAHPARLPGLAGPGLHLQRQPLQSTDRGVIANDNLGRPQQLPQQCDERLQPFLHRQRLRLHDQRVAKLIDDDTRKIIRFGPDQPRKS